MIQTVLTTTSHSFTSDPTLWGHQVVSMLDGDMLDVGEPCDKVVWSCADNFTADDVTMWVETNLTIQAGVKSVQISSVQMRLHTHTHTRILTHLAVSEYAAHLFICTLTFFEQYPLVGSLLLWGSACECVYVCLCVCLRSRTVAKPWLEFWAECVSHLATQPGFSKTGRKLQSQTG